MKTDPKFKIIPVVILSSSESPTDIRDCYEHYSSCYVVKPFDSKEFAHTVREVVKFWSNIGQLPQ